MSSLLVWARQDNKVGKKKADHWMQFARGDVVDLQDEDDFHWGDAIMGPDALGWWRVVQVTGTPAKALQSLSMGDGKTVVPGKPHRIRALRVDLDALEAKEGRTLAHYEMLVVSYADLLPNIAEKIVKPQDASVIGFAPTVIG